ncbi:MAG: hypothetical protein KBB01_03670 [Candidatus Omnitrophica bacterium]|nr:hypothetical protein [Candidatus Omnitrophota bacterium]
MKKMTSDSSVIEQRWQDLKEIAIVIDSWDDIFSDFDPRPLSERTVSGDFVDELKKRYRETRRGDFIIKIYAPLALKNEESERKVTQRLKRDFRLQYLQKIKVLRRIRIRGMVFILIGVSSLSFLTLATYFKFLDSLILEICGIILMPLGWFGFWEGLSKLIDTSPVFLQESSFFEKLSKATYQFHYLNSEDTKK